MTQNKQPEPPAQDAERNEMGKTAAEWDAAMREPYPYPMTCPDCHSRPTGRGYFGKPYCAFCERTLRPLRDGEAGLSGVRRDRDGRVGG